MSIHQRIHTKCEMMSSCREKGLKMGLVGLARGLRQLELRKHNSGMWRKRINWVGSREERLYSKRGIDLKITNPSVHQYSFSLCFFLDTQLDWIFHLPFQLSIAIRPSSGQWREWDWCVPILDQGPGRRCSWKEPGSLSFFVDHGLSSPLAWDYDVSKK